MEYTYLAYINLMKSLIDNGYTPIRFKDISKEIEYPAIIRHDVDVDLEKAVKMAAYENEMGVKSTYFVMLSSEYYNLFSGRNLKCLKKILNLGHEIGLHFDITAYKRDITVREIEEELRREIVILEGGADIKVKSVSWHIPSQNLIGVHLDITDELGIYNAYDPYFYNGYKYVSDSMMRWREPIEEYVAKKQYRKLQILTHPIWYRDIQDMTDIEILECNISKKKDIENRYLDMIRPGYLK